jgi:hypothetical protein
MRDSADWKSGSGGPDVLSLQALGTFGHVERNPLAFLQSAKTAGLDGGVMHEYVATTITGDEPVTLAVVKPLYSSLFHGVVLE